MCFYRLLSTKKKGYKCYHPPLRKFFISMDMDITFSEKQSFFQNPYLQGKPPSSMEDKDLFLDFPASSYGLKSEDTTTIPTNVPKIPATAQEIPTITSIESESETVIPTAVKSNPIAAQTLQVYSRRKVCS